MQYNPKMERGGDVIKRYTICQIAGNHNSSFLGILDSFVFGDDCFLSMRGIDVMKIWSFFSKVHLITKWTRFTKSLCSVIDLDSRNLFSTKGQVFGCQSALLIFYTNQNAKNYENYENIRAHNFILAFHRYYIN